MHWSSDKSLRSQCVYMCVCERHFAKFSINCTSSKSNLNYMFCETRHTIPTLMNTFRRTVGFPLITVDF